MNFRPEPKHQVHFTYAESTESAKATSRLSYLSEATSRAGSAAKTRHLNRISPKSKIQIKNSRVTFDSTYCHTNTTSSFFSSPTTTHSYLYSGGVPSQKMTPVGKQTSPYPNNSKPTRPQRNKPELRPGISHNQLQPKEDTDAKSNKNCSENTQKEEQQLMAHSLSYDSIKPTVGWRKYVILCGMDHGNSSDGCHCSKPCKWAANWTRYYRPQNKKPYEKLLKQKTDPANTQQISKDLLRTYPQCPTFSTNFQFQSRLMNVLTAYAVYDHEVGYVQGMNMVAGALLYHIKEEDQTFWGLVELMDEQELRMIYLSGFEMLKKHISNIDAFMHRKIPDLANHLSQLGVTPEVFLYGWLLSLMSNCIPLEYMHLVIDEFRSRGWIFIYQLVLTYLTFIKEALLLAEDSSEALSQLNNDNAKSTGIYWQELVHNCHKVGN